MPATALTAMTEQQLLDCVIEAAHLFGWKAAHFRPARTANGWRTPVSGDGAGFPDLVMTRERVLFAELKSAKGVLSDEQSDWVGGLVGAKAEFHLWKPEDWQDGTIENVLRRRSSPNPVSHHHQLETERATQ